MIKEYGIIDVSRLFSGEKSKAEKMRDTDLILRLPLTDRGVWQVFLTGFFVLICDTNGINSVCFRLSLLFYLLDECVKRLTMAS